jgi:serine/threonine-protein kinase
MAEVFRARDAGGREVAIKVLRTSSEGAEGIKRFEREAAIIAGFDHPNIVKLFDYRITSDGTRIMIMEYVPGLSLSAHVQDAGVPLEHALGWLGDLCEALDYAHSRGVVHRDIKPSNVLVEPLGTDPPRWRAVLTDFGIAKIDATTQLTRSQLIGTVTHMSPEQIRDPAHVDHRSDIYSLGVLAFQLLTGQVPFDARGATAVLLAHLQQPPPDPRRLRPDLPDFAARAVLRALAKRPASRFASAGEMLLTLREGAEGPATRAG